MIQITAAPYQEQFIKNLFTVLSADRGSRIFGRRGFTEPVREMNIPKETLTLWFEGWKKEPAKIIISRDAEENRQMVYHVCAAVLADDAVHADVMQSLISYAASAGIDRQVVSSLFSNRVQYIAERSFLRRAEMIRTAYDVRDRKDPQAKKEKKNTSFYVANHVTYEGLDELQRLLMAHRLDCHAAIDGPPGVGKTHSVIEVSDILGMSLYTKTCSSRTTESHIISYPVLSVQEGASVTSHVNGPLACAMIEPGVFYGDEFNLLKEDVQKRLNSSFDERRSIDRNDGVQVKAKPGFWAVISYNPTQNLTSRDLEDSVADRFIHLHYERWNPAFKAYVTHRKAFSGNGGSPAAAPGSGKEFGVTLEWRGISPDCRFYAGRAEEGQVKWYDFFNGKPAPEKPAYVYQVFDTGSIIKKHDAETEKILSDLEKNAFSPVDFAKMLSQFTDLLHSLKRTGKSPLLKKIGMAEAIQDEDLELLSLHESSARIEVAALKHYHLLTERGFNRYLAQSYSVRLVIDQICYGQYRDKKLRDHSVHELVTIIAKGMRLVADFARYNTSPQAALHRKK